MGVRQWAVRPGELRPLSRSGLLLFAARCALRVEPWRVGAAAARWDDALAFVVACAVDPSEAPAPAAEVRARAGALADIGARACNRLDASDEPLGRGHNYAHGTLVQAIEATGIADRKALVQAVLLGARLSASIAAVWAHAGRVAAPAGVDAVTLASTTTWAAIRADIAPAITAATSVAREPTPTRVAALRAIAPLWVGDPPPWATPG